MLSVNREKEEVNMNEKASILSTFESKVNIRFKQEEQTRQILEVKMNSIIEDRFNHLKAEITKQGRTRYEAIEEMKTHFEGDIPKLSHTAKFEINERKEKDEEIERKIQKECGEIRQIINNEKKIREDNDQGFLQAIQLSLGKFKDEVAKERTNRETTEDTFLSLLEDTCNKIDENNFF